jgi:hypothetical protein
MSKPIDTATVFDVGDGEVGRVKGRWLISVARTLSREDGFCR